MSRGQENERAIARYHEAGHAVAVLACGGEVTKLTANNCRFRTSNPFHDVIVGLAGAKAARVHGPNWRSMNRNKSPGDRKLIEEALEAMGPDRPVTTVEQAADHAKAIVTWKHGAAVKRVGYALQKAGQLSGAQVQRLFDGEAVEDVLASPTPADRPKPTTRTTPPTDGPTRIAASLWKLDDGRWAARPEGSDALTWRHVEAVADSDTGALRALRDRLAEETGGPVELTAA